MKWQQLFLTFLAILVQMPILSACQPSHTVPTQTATPTPAIVPALSPTATYEPFQPTETPIPEVLAPAWGEEMLIYLVFVSSFYDSNGDGIGDLAGLIEKLDYLNDGDPTTSDDLGVTAIWMMPIFDAISYHGYDTIDYFTIRPAYGTQEDLIRLVEECHKRGIRVLLDYVLDSVSNQHPFFQDAYQNPDSPYADWFIWYNEEHTKYQSFANIDIVPSINGDSLEVRKYALEIAQYWMDLDGDGDLTDGIDGFRCDYALGLSHGFWKTLRSQVKEWNPDFLLLGEVWGTAKEIVSYYDGQFDSTFDFPLYTILVGHHDTVGHGVLGADEKPGLIHAALFQRRNLYPWGALSVIMLNNHDTNRLMSVVEGDTEQAKLAATLLFTLSGAPLIYYGEEIGMAGVKGDGKPYWDEYRREPMDWYCTEEGPGMTTWFKPSDRNNQPNDGVSVEEQFNDPRSLLSHYRLLSHVRQTHSALRAGEYERIKVIDGPDSIYAYVRQDVQGHILVVLNFSHEPVQAVLDLGSSTLPSPPWEAQDLITSNSLPLISGGTYEVDLPAQTGFILALSRP
jgi:alpha-amylase